MTAWGWRRTHRDRRDGRTVRDGTTVSTPGSMRSPALLPAAAQNLAAALLAAAALASAVALTVATPAGLDGQSLYVGVRGDRSTFNEAQDGDRLTGFGAVGSVRFETGSWALEAEAAWRSLSPSAEDRDGSVTFLSGGARGRYAVWRTLSVEAGWEARSADPEFAAQDLGMALVGLHYAAALTSIADVWIRGAAIPFSTFNGGGDSGIGVGLGLGLRVGPAGASWRGVMEYRFRRIDRTVRDIDVPIQVDGIQLGVEYAVF